LASLYKELFLVINDLFGKQSERNKKNIKNEAKDICVFDSNFAQPLIYGLDKMFNCIKVKPEICSERLRQGQVDIGMISSLDYSKGKGNWKIIPEICVSTKGAGKLINLFFNKEIKEIDKIAIDPNDSTATALLNVIMREKYEIAPDFVVIDGDLKDKLNNADAAITSGDQAFQYQQTNSFYLDLCDEWFDFTGLPFVYAFWVVNENSIVDEYINSIKNNTTNINTTILECSKELSEINNENIKVYIDYFENIISSPLGDEENEGLNEFFRYAFFFGIIEHIPDLHYLR